ncbi:protein FAM98B isoform X1 [Ctenopharyngodon idella]|uniref:protein FAM98B isoform X1 n=1 Tax=Ctenopharyngodon idella TaxID=7959 RepID=UPI002231F237|nr:protein FAM98B isoform X1 [Ctenopharyngodon idella]
MERDTGAIALIKALGYKSRECLKTCQCDELPCPLLTWLVSELRASCPDVPAQRVGGAVLVGELREVLKEMSCPQNALLSEHLSPLLLFRVTEYLVSELMAARMLQYRESHPEDADQNCETNSKEQRKQESLIMGNEDEHQKTSQAEEDKTNWKEVNKSLAELFQTLGLETSSQMSDACAEVESRLTSLPEGEMPEALLNTSLNSEQWKKINDINRALCKDYECRRQMMIKRFYVTLQSFAWGERGKERSAVLSSMPPFSPSPESSVSIAMLLATREDESRIRPVKAGPSTAVHKVLMGSVPDRGGRPGEIEPPMPSFTGRSEGGGSHQQYRKRRREYSGKKKKDKKN